ncbi:hypothetical protein G6355_11295 [Vibrio cholerae]|uniref:hypothetical protein n=1 Tax=Vibrio cholerae TaxID=666 RepID=UPI002F308268
MMVHFIDTEISGFRAYDQVIELGILNSNGDIIFNELITGAESIVQGMPHRIKIDELNNGFKPDDLDRIIFNTKDVLICSYGLQFDLNWLKHTFLLHNGKISEIRELRLNGLCLLEVVQSLTSKKISLDNSLKLFNIPLPKQCSNYMRHRALYDANLHKLLFEYLYKSHRNEIIHKIRAFDMQDI